jgi:hypothetical protein
MIKMRLHTHDCSAWDLESTCKSSLRLDLSDVVPTVQTYSKHLSAGTLEPKTDEHVHTHARTCSQRPCVYFLTVSVPVEAAAPCGSTLGRPTLLKKIRIALLCSRAASTFKLNCDCAIQTLKAWIVVINNICCAFGLRGHLFCMFIVLMCRFLFHWRICLQIQCSLTETISIDNAYWSCKTNHDAPPFVERWDSLKHTHTDLLSLPSAFFLVGYNCLSQWNQMDGIKLVGTHNDARTSACRRTQTKFIS